MIKRMWWAFKVALFPHLDRRRESIPTRADHRQPRRKMCVAESMLNTAIVELYEALEKHEERHDERYRK